MKRKRSDESEEPKVTQRNSEVGDCGGSSALQASIKGLGWVDDFLGNVACLLFCFFFFLCILVALRLNRLSATSVRAQRD